jgi:peptide/nickel transport system permease protein
MRAYVIRRLALIVPTLLAVTIAVFLTVRFIPGSVVDLMAAEMLSDGGGGTNTTDLTERIRHQLGLDVPIHLQYLRWLGVMPQEDGGFHGILQGDLGSSLWG